MKALVTGCAGFIGSHLVERLLSQNYEVIGIDSFTNYYSRHIKLSNIKNAQANKNFSIIDDDILEFREFPDVDYIFHQAAQPGVRMSWGKDFEIYLKDNVLVTQKLLEVYKDKKIKKFIYASSSSVYGDASLPLNEERLPKPISPYGVSKLAAENLCYLYYQNFNIPVVSLRYFTVYGPRQRPDMAINKFANAILDNEEISIYGDGEQKRDFTFIDDVIQANIMAARSSLAGEVYNVGGESNISINEVISLLQEIICKKANIKYIEKQKGDVNHTLADITKIKKQLQWSPFTKIEKGLENYIIWLINQLKYQS